MNAKFLSSEALYFDSGRNSYETLVIGEGRTANEMRIEKHASLLAVSIVGGPPSRSLHLPAQNLFE